jgi:hypothetical protein
MPDGDPLALHDVRPEDERTHALLELVLAEVRALRAEIAVRRDAPDRALDPAHRAVLRAILPTIAGIVAGRAFTVTELQRHARLAEFGALRAAIDRAGGANRLGRLLRRAATAGYEIDGYRVKHVGVDRDGNVFTVASAANHAAISPHAR